MLPLYGTIVYLCELNDADPNFSKRGSFFQNGKNQIFQKEYFKELTIRWSKYLKRPVIFPLDEYTRKPSVVTNLNLPLTNSIFLH
jgi:hypothetical protein